MNFPSITTWTPGSIRLRLILWSVGVMALVLVAMAVILRFTVQSALLESIDRQMARREKRFEESVASDGPRRYLRWMKDASERRRAAAASPASSRATSPPSAPSEMPFPAGFRGRDEQRGRDDQNSNRLRRHLYDREGDSLTGNKDEVLLDKEGFHQALLGNKSFASVRINGEPMRVYSLPLAMKGGEVEGVLQDAVSLEEMDRDLDALSRTLVTLVPLALLFVGVSAAFLTERLLRPVRQITETTGQINAADLSRRLEVSGKDEFSRLSTTINAMLGRLDVAFEQQRRFTADASHELRTPLTAIKAHTSLALMGEKTPAEYRKALGGADRAATQMNRIIQDLLLLARSDSGQLQMDIRPTKIVSVLEDASASLVGRDHTPIEILALDPDLMVMGDSSHLTRLILNLLDNAANYTPRDGSITVSVEASGDKAVIKVTDTGCGIAPEHLPEITKRFYRADEARTRKHGGTGLGLAICQSIVDAHHGLLTIDSALDKGTSVVVTLPRG